jgi:hypothetical protein
MKPVTKTLNLCKFQVFHQDGDLLDHCDLNHKGLVVVSNRLNIVYKHHGPSTI